MAGTWKFEHSRLSYAPIPTARSDKEDEHGTRDTISRCETAAVMSEAIVDANAPPPRHYTWVWGVAFFIIISVGIFFYTHRKTTPANTAGPPDGKSSGAGPGGGGGGRGGVGGPVMITAEPARNGDIGVYVNALGLVTPLNTVAVRGRVEGQLVKILYTEGQWVKEGDPLAEIDPAPFQAALAQAEGQFARDSALLENARLDLKRYEDAFARNAVPRQQLDTQNSTVRQYEGAVKLDQGQVENAKVQLNYCHIKAPISGRVGLRMVDQGNIVRSTDANPLVMITQLRPITVVFSVAEDYLPQIQKQTRDGHKLTVDAFDRSQERKIASGVLETIDNQIDVGTGTVKLKATFANEDEGLFPNQFVNARLLVETHRNVTLVPNRAIQRGARGSFVFAVKTGSTNSVVAAQPIEIGASNSDVSEARGLEPGTMIAVDNFNRLNDGAKVIIRPPPDAAQKGPPAGTPGGAPASTDRAKKGSS
jgi:multidrug efflux system membrane fusion protein